jgi:hypothetical protein
MQREQCILFSVVFTPSPPATMAVFWSYLSSLYFSNTVIAGAGLPNHMMAINGRGFLGPKKKTIRLSI